MVHEAVPESWACGRFVPALWLQIERLFVPPPSPVKISIRDTENEDGAVNWMPRIRFGPPMLTRSL